MSASVRRRIAASIVALAARATCARRAAAARSGATPRARQHGRDQRSGSAAEPAVLRLRARAAGQRRARRHAGRVRRDEGRVAAFVRDAAGTWMRRQTLTASNAVPGAGFGEHIAIFNNRALITSRSAVYIFQLQSGKWQQTGKLPFGRTVQVRDLDWHWNTVVVGASDSTGNAAYAFHMNADGTFHAHRAHRAARRDASDRFGEHVAVYSTTVAATAPGYNSEQGAAYVFTCTETQCVAAAEAARQRRAAGRRLRPARSISRTAFSWSARPRPTGCRAIRRSRRARRTIVPAVPRTCSCAAAATWTEQQKLQPERAAAELVCDVRLSGRRLGNARRRSARRTDRRVRAGLRARLSLVGRLAGREPAS